MTTEEIISLIPEVIAQLPPAGEFAQLRFDLPIIMMDNANINNTKEKIKNIVQNTNELAIIEAVIQYLIFEGFIINRHDIKDDTTLYRQLTDKGRKLKEYNGDINKFKKWVLHPKIAIHFR